MSICLRQDTKNQHYSLIDERGKPLAQANAFLDALRVRGLSSYTIRAYGYDLVALLRWMQLRGFVISNLQNSSLLDFANSCRQAGVGPRSINRMLMTIRSFFRFCTNQELENGKGASLPAGYYRGRRRNYLGHGARAPRNRVLQLKVPQLLIEPLTVNQVRLLLSKMSRHRDLCIVYLMLLSGLRTQEVIGIKISDIDFNENRFLVRGKGGKERMLPLPKFLHAAIVRYLKLERPDRSSSDALFVVLQGKHRGMKLTPDGVRSLFRHRRQHPTLKNANAHRLRHTFGTDMARAGITLPVLQRLMGHSDLKITLQYINLSMADVAQELSRTSEQIQRRYGRS